MMKATRGSRVPLLLGALALLCYLPAVGWGVPLANAPDRGHAWGVDDETPLGSLSEVRGIRRGPAANRNLGYPLGHPLVVAAASAPYLGFLALTGGLSGTSEGYPHGLTNPAAAVSTLGLIGHLVSVIFALAVVLASWFAARELWGESAGALAGVMMTTVFPMFYYARTGNVDMAQLGWMACALASVARIFATGVTPSRAAWLGAFIGAAVGTKEPIAATFLALPPLLLGIQWRDQRRGHSQEHWWVPGLVAFAGFAVSFGVFSGFFVDSQRYIAHLEFGRNRVNDMGQGDVAFAHFFPWTIDGHLQLSRVLLGLLSDAMTWPGLALALAGIALAAVRRLRNAWLVLPGVTYLAVLFLTARVAQLRYIMPAVWVLVLFAAYAVASAWNARPALLRWSGVAATVLMITLNFARGIDLTHAMLNDSRYQATAWFNAHATPGSRIAYFGSRQKLPYLAADVRVELGGEYRGAVFAVPTDEAAAMRIVERWRADPPDFIVLMPDHSSQPGVPYPASCPPSLVDALDAGTVGYQSAAFFETPAWLPWIGRPLLDYPTVNPPIRIYRRIRG